MFYKCTLYLNGIESASVRDEQIDWIVFVSKNKNCWEQLDVSLKSGCVTMSCRVVEKI